jgi:hypothetical protein
LLGLAHLWRLAEPLPADMAPAVQLTSANAARDHLRRAYELCPTDHRIAAWLGPILVRFGRTVNDPAMVAEGEAVLDTGIAALSVVRAVLEAVDPRRRAARRARVPAGARRGGRQRRRVRRGGRRSGVRGSPARRPQPRGRAGVLRRRAGQGRTPGRGRGDLHGGAGEPGLRDLGLPGRVATGRLATLDARIAAYATPDTADDPEAAWAAPNQCALCHTE